MSPVVVKVLADVGALGGAGASGGNFSPDAGSSAVPTHILMSAPETATLDGVMCVYDDESVRQMREVRRRNPDWVVYAVVPNMSEISRAVNQYGMTGAALRRIRGLGPRDVARLGPLLVRRLGKIVRRDMRGLLPALTAIEMMALGRLRLSAVLLHAAVADVAVANDDAPMVAAWLAFIRDRYGLRAGLVTRNPGQTLEWALREELDIDLLAAPINARGWSMHPGQRATEEAVRSWGGELVATDPLCEWTLGCHDAMAYVRSLGIQQIAAPLSAREDLARVKALIDFVRSSTTPTR